MLSRTKTVCSTELHERLLDISRGTLAKTACGVRQIELPNGDHLRLEKYSSEGCHIWHTDASAPVTFEKWQLYSASHRALHYATNMVAGQRRSIENILSAFEQEKFDPLTISKLENRNPHFFHSQLDTVGLSNPALSAIKYHLQICPKYTTPRGLQDVSFGNALEYLFYDQVDSHLFSLRNIGPSRAAEICAVAFKAALITDDEVRLFAEKWDQAEKNRPGLDIQRFWRVFQSTLEIK